MSLSKKIDEWKIPRPGPSDDIIAKIYLEKPNNYRELEDSLRFYAEFELAGKTTKTESYEDINELRKLLFVTANPLAQLEWNAVYLTAIDNHQRQNDETGPATASAQISYRLVWMAKTATNTYYCLRNPANCDGLRPGEISERARNHIGHVSEKVPLFAYPATPENRTALENIIAKMQNLGESLSQINSQGELLQPNLILPALPAQKTSKDRI